MKYAVPFLLALLFCVAGCQSPEQQAAIQQRAVMNDAIKNEPPGDYFIGRRYYKVDYKFWGYVRSPGQPWSASKLVMMDENTKLAPDRAAGHLGSDHGYEYKLYGKLDDSPSTYEPASNSFYPEFHLTGYELISSTPTPIITAPGANDPQRRIIQHPQ